MPPQPEDGQIPGVPDYTARLAVADGHFEGIIAGGITSMLAQGGRLALVARYLEHAVSNAKLVREIVENDDLSASKNLVQHGALHSALVEAYISIADHLAKLITDLVLGEDVAVESAGPVLQMNAQMMMSAEKWADFVEPNSDLRTVLREKSASAQIMRETFGNWRLVADSATSSSEVLDAQRESAGQSAEISLSDDFEKLRVREAGSADNFRKLAIGLYAVAISFAVLVAFVWGEDDEFSDVLQRLACAIPLLLLAAYLGHEGAGHRRTAEWAGVLVAQLRSARAYTAQFPPEEDERRYGLLEEFGRRVFLESPGAPSAAEGQPAETPLPGGADVVAIMREAGQLIEQAQRRSSP